MENEVQPVAPITQPTVQTPIPVQPTHNKSNWLKIVLFAVLGLLFLAGAVYAGMQIGKKQTSNQQSVVIQPNISPTQVAVNPTDLSATPSPTTDPTADWKTYKNIALDFELKYPPFVEIDLEMNDQHNRAAIFKGGNIYIEVMLRKAGDTPLDKYYYMDNPGFTKSVIDGKTANVYTYDASKNSCVSDGSGPGCPLSYVTYVAQNGLDLYHFSFFGDSILSDTEKKILSTFKFLNSTNTTINSNKIGYIKSIVSNNDIYKIQVDYIDLIRDNTAPNGNRIDNPSTELTTISVEKNPTIIMQTYSLTPDGKSFNYDQSITFSEFLNAFNSNSHIKNVPYWIEIQNGKLVKITEQYLP